MQTGSSIYILLWRAVIRVIYRWALSVSKGNARIDAEFKKPEGGVPKIRVPVCMASYLPGSSSLL
jgi:hypothetical protein